VSSSFVLKITLQKHSTSTRKLLFKTSPDCSLLSGNSPSAPTNPATLPTQAAPDAGVATAPRPRRTAAAQRPGDRGHRRGARVCSAVQRARLIAATR